ncbi:MAG TPA: beta-L-arabinofuranosidase domain-containing protein, partial [Steroidobacteraceae bacterium]|nr:beta-L-arabinofuranosidase domain-containing protein [Steroidobacteraceae bacterium]
MASLFGLPRASLALQRDVARPFPLSAVRLGPSPWLQAVAANRAYLHRLEPDRLLHGYRVAAGLAPRGERYGGWEQETIAGHTLGHYLSACALMHAQTGDPECSRRVSYIVSELAACQAAGRDGFVAAFTRRVEATGAIEPGRRVMEELARGEIHPARFYLNGCWAPFYNWHKLFAGLLDAGAHCGNREAIGIAERLAGFIELTLANLDHAAMQSVLGTEFGGMSEVLAELSALTGNARWMRLAERFHHDVVLAPLIAGRDELAFLHANTQIPKLIGLARHAELTGDPRELEGARFFWRAVTAERSYVIGGNSDREYFQEPGSLSRYITEQTCESCNTYNMLKLTRHLFAAEPLARYFDYYERAHLNHILAHQRPGDGAFAYMVPLMSGTAREWSEPFDSFWCCVGTGMESHAKHGDSIFWEGSDALYVNLYIPATLDWQ